MVEAELRMKRLWRGFLGTPARPPASSALDLSRAIARVPTRRRVGRRDSGALRPPAGAGGPIGPRPLRAAQPRFYFVFV